MFEKVALRTANTLYALAVGTGVLWLAWLCLAHLPLWAAVLGFCIALPLLALLLAPLAAACALVGGAVAGLAVISGRAVRPARHAD